MRAPGHAALSRADIGCPPLSPSVDAPSCANADERASLTTRWMWFAVATLAEGEGFEPSRGLVAPYSLSRRAPSATRSALRDPSIRATGGYPDGGGRSAASNEWSQPRAASCTSSRRSAPVVGAARTRSGVANASPARYRQLLLFTNAATNAK